MESLIEYVDSSSQAHVIQKYLENPMLLTGRRKFDVRYKILSYNNLQDNEFNLVNLPIILIQDAVIQKM